MSFLAGRAHVSALAGLGDQLGAATATLSALLGVERPERRALGTDLAAILAAADKDSRALLIEVERAFVTPIDRVLLADLSTAIPDVIERLHGAAELILEHRLGEVPDETVDAIALIERAAEIIAEGLRSFGNPRNLIPLQYELRRIMREARSSLRQGLAEAVSSTPDPRLAQRERDVIRQFQRATESVDAVAAILRSVAVRES